jgi:hypothetical protein
LRIETCLVDLPECVKIGLLEWADAKLHAVIVAGL